MANNFPTTILTGETDKNIFICGGWSETNDASEEIQQISDRVKPKVETVTGKNYVVFKAVKYRNQFVSGQNFLIKVHAGEEDYLHLMVFRGLGCVLVDVLQGVEQHRTKDSPLEPFTK